MMVKKNLKQFTEIGELFPHGQKEFNNVSFMQKKFSVISLQIQKK